MWPRRIQWIKVGLGTVRPYVSFPATIKPLPASSEVAGHPVGAYPAPRTTCRLVQNLTRDVARSARSARTSTPRRGVGPPLPARPVAVPHTPARPLAAPRTARRKAARKSDGTAPLPQVLGFGPAPRHPRPRRAAPRPPPQADCRAWILERTAPFTVLCLPTPEHGAYLHFFRSSLILLNVKFKRVMR